MKRIRVGTAVLCAVFAATTALAACGNGGNGGGDDTGTGGAGGDGDRGADASGAAGAGAGTGTILAVTPFTVQSLHPIEQGLWSPEWGYGELLMRATEEGTVEPWLAERLESVDPGVWDLYLRDDVTFSSGEPLDAETMQTVFEHHIADNPLVSSRLPGLEVEVTDELRLRLTTGRTAANLPNLLADERMISVFDPEVLDAAGDDTDALIDADLYTGPFVVTSLTADELVLERNEDYWAGDVALAGATVQFVPEPQARVQAVQSGQADLALYPPTEAVTSLRDADTGARSVLAEQPLQQLRAFLNQHKAPMDDVEVRRAFSLGLDYAAIAEEVMDGVYSTPIGMYPESMPYAEQTQVTDPERAETLLDDAGWERGDGGVRERDGEPLEIVVLTYPQQPDTGAIAVAMKSQLDPLGFDVRIEEVPGNYEAMEDPDGWDVGLSFDGTLGYTYDPVAPLQDFLTSDGAYNFGGVADRDLDLAVNGLGSALNETAMGLVIADVQDIVGDQVYTVIVAQRSSPAIVGDALADYRPSSVLHHLTASTDVAG